MLESQGTKKSVFKLITIVLGMFAFGFLLVPLYDIVCEVTGLNGKTAGRYQLSGNELVDEGRRVTVQFLTNRNANMSWSFRPQTRSVEVVPGELNEAQFFVRNDTDSTMVGKAIPSVTPFTAADYLHKTECFCFNQQPLDAGKEADMPLRFIVDRDLPKDIHVITLSYTIFDVTEMAAKQDSVAASK